jgi:hypothetical protein
MKGFLAVFESTWIGWLLISELMAPIFLSFYRFVKVGVGLEYLLEMLCPGEHL